MSLLTGIRQLRLLFRAEAPVKEQKFPRRRDRCECRPAWDGNWQLALFVAGVLVVTMQFVAVDSAWPVNGPIRVSEQRVDTATKQLGGPMRIQVILGTIEAVLFLGAVVFSGWAARSASKAAKAADDAVRVASDTAKRQLRAYVSARPTYVFSFDDTKAPQVRYRIENFGLTPAHEVQHYGVVRVLSYPIPDDFVRPELEVDQNKRTVLFQNLPIFGDAFMEQPPTIDQLRSIRSGAARLYIFGIVSYVDQFEEPRLTEFGASVRADRDTLAKLTENYASKDLSLEFEQTEPHNTAT